MLREKSDGMKKFVAVEVDKTLWKRFKQKCKSEGKTLSAATESLIRKQVNLWEKENGKVE